jgi:hypothetical protein
MLQELQDTGYLTRTKNQNTKTGIFEWESTLHETPQFAEKKERIKKKRSKKGTPTPVVGNPPAVSPVVGNPPAVNPPAVNRTLVSTEVVSTEVVSTEVVSTEKKPNPTPTPSEPPPQEKPTATTGWVGLPDDCTDKEQFVFELLTDEEIAVTPAKALTLAQTPSLTPATVVAHVATWQADRVKQSLDTGALVHRIQAGGRTKTIPPAFLASPLYRRHYPLREEQVRARTYLPDPPPIDPWIAELPLPVQ